MALAISASHGLAVLTPVPIAAAAIIGADWDRLSLFGVPLAILLAVFGTAIGLAVAPLVSQSLATMLLSANAGEGVFLACSFWMVSALKLQGRDADAKKLFERVLSLANDVGLLAEEYDTGARRLVGNFPQALSHIALVNAAFDLAGSRAGIEPAQK